MIRVATDADWQVIPEVHRAAFKDEGDRVARLAWELYEGEWYEPELSFVAEQDGAVVGHVMNTWSTIEGSDARVLQFSPLGVLPEHQGKGHGSALVRASLEAVRARGEPVLVLEGDPKYYGRFGFVRADELGLLPPPECRWDWAFQAAVLNPEAQLPQGRVVYSPPFRSSRAARARGRSAAHDGGTGSV